MPPWPGWNLALVFLVLSGCVGGSDPAEGLGLDSELAFDARFDDSTGAIAGIATDDALVPVPDATVAFEGGSVNVTTDAEGRFAFSFVPPGSVVVVATRLGYQNATEIVNVVAGAVARASLLLVALPSDEAYHATQQSEGRMLCAADTRPQRFVLNVCGSLMFAPVSSGEKSFSKYPLAEPTGPKLVGLVFETRWVTNQALGRGLDVYWEAFQEITNPTTFPEGEPRRFARVNGTSPLRATANETVIDTILNFSPAPLHCHDGARCTVMSRTFPRATTLGPSSPVDAAFYVDQRFTHYLTEFHGRASPTGFTVLPDA